MEFDAKAQGLGDLRGGVGGLQAGEGVLQRGVGVRRRGRLLAARAYQYDQLAQAYTQYQSQGDITGEAAVTLPKAISALGDALGVL